MRLVVDQTPSNTGAATTSVVVTPTRPIHDGDLLVAVCGFATNSGLSSISGGGTWTKDRTDSSATVRVEIWSCPNAAGGTASVTFNVNSTDDVAIQMIVIRAGRLSSPLANAIGGFSTSGNPTFSSNTVLYPNVISVVGATWQPTSSTYSSETAGWTAVARLTVGTSFTLAVSYMIATNASSQPWRAQTYTLSAGTTAWAISFGNYVEDAGSYVQKFYFHDATASTALIGGTLPGSGSVSGFSPNVTATGASTNRLMDGTIGSGQVTTALTTQAVTTSQTNWFRRFVSLPLQAQSFYASMGLQFGQAGFESNTNSNMWTNGSVQAWIWRPMTGAVVGNLVTTFLDVGSTEPGTTQTAMTAIVTTGGSDVVAIDGDIIVVELWSKQTQGMGTAYTNTIAYDGTTESSTTNEAANLRFPINIALLKQGLAPPPRVVRQAINRSAVW